MSAAFTGRFAFRKSFRRLLKNCGERRWNVYTLPKNWPAPEYAIGEVVYEASRRVSDFPYPGRVLGLLYYPPLDGAMEQGTWRYLVAWEGYPAEEWSAEKLTREPGQYTPLPATAPVEPQPEEYDPFFDDDDLP